MIAFVHLQALMAMRWAIGATYFRLSVQIQMVLNCLYVGVDVTRYFFFAHAIVIWVKIGSS